MQENEVPAVPPQPPVTVSVVETPNPWPDALVAVIEKLCPICPAPAAVDCVGGSETDVITSPLLQPAQVTAMPGTNGRAPADRPLEKVAVWPLIAPPALAA